MHIPAMVQFDPAPAPPTFMQIRVVFFQNRGPRKDSVFSMSKMSPISFILYTYIRSTLVEAMDIFWEEYPDIITILSDQLIVQFCKFMTIL